LFIPLYFAYQFIPYRSGYEYTNIFYFIKPYWPVSSPLLFPWANFDGVHYLSIATKGYTDNERFFPLFPILINSLSVIFRNQFFVGLFISNVCLLLCLIVFYKLICFDYPKKTALWSIIFFIIFPTSFYFVGIYAESLFLLLTLLSFYYSRRRQWLIASFFAFLLTITRPIGIIIFPVLIYEFIVIEKKLSAKILPIFIVPFGIIGYAFYNLKKWGDALYFLKAQADLGNSRTVTSIILFPQTIYRYFKILSTIPNQQYEWWIALLELSFFFFTVFILYVAWRKKIRTSYLLFSILAFLIPISSGTFSGLPRYVAVLFPIFITFSLIKSKALKIIYVIIGVFLLFFLLMFFSRGYYVA
jgi:Gpi18-like mannosyltransferase